MKKLLLITCLLICSASVKAQNEKGDTSTVQTTGAPLVSLTDLNITEHNALRIEGLNHEFLVKIHPDGKIEYGPSYTPDGVARVMWEALENYGGHRIHELEVVNKLLEEEVKRLKAAKSKKYSRKH